MDPECIKISSNLLIGNPKPKKQLENILNRHVTEEEIQMAKKIEKKSSLFWVTSEIQIKR